MRIYINFLIRFIRRSVRLKNPLLKAADEKGHVCNTVAPPRRKNFIISTVESFAYFGGNRPRRGKIINLRPRQGDRRRPMKSQCTVDDAGRTGRQIRLGLEGGHFSLRKAGSTGIDTGVSSCCAAGMAVGTPLAP